MVLIYLIRVGHVMVMRDREEDYRKSWESLGVIWKRNNKGERRRTTI